MFSPKTSPKTLIHYRDCRKADRAAAGESIEVQVPDPELRSFAAQAKDLRNNGFHLVYAAPRLAAGTEFRFLFSHLHGRGRVMWSVETGGTCESACVVLDDGPSIN